MSTTLSYQQNINAAKPVVWHVLTDAQLYRQWANAFSAKSRFEGEWKQGNTMLFIDPDLGGTKALLETIIPEKSIQARHVALIDQNGQESTTGEMADTWINTIEAYELSENAEQTQITVTIETHENWVEMFNTGFPKALANIKALAENSGR